MSDIAKEILKIASKAVKEAQRKSLANGVANGVANVYSKNGNIYFQLPNGEITQEKPKAYAS